MFYVIKGITCSTAIGAYVSYLETIAVAQVRELGKRRATYSSPLPGDPIHIIRRKQLKS